jgi:amino acid permease
MVTKVQMKAYFTAMATIMLFITFFAQYILYQSELSASFIHGVVTYVVTIFIMNALYLLWRVTYSADEWKTIVQSPPLHEDSEQEEILNEHTDEMEELLSDL